MKASLRVIALLAAAGLAGCGRSDRTSPDELRGQIAALEKERDELRVRLDAAMQGDPLIEGMPSQPVRVGVPTELARDLITKVVTGFVDQVTLELKNLKVRKAGTVKKVVTIGQYELDVLIHRVSGKLKTGSPEVSFGGNQVKLALPVTVASGSGRATIRFKWDGRNVSGAVCGDMEVTQEVSGGVKPASYPVAGGLELRATAREILAQPRFPQIKVRLNVQPSAESWAAVQKLLDEKTGVCGYVVEKVNVLKIVQGLIDRGFNVRLPTEKIKAMAIPVGIEPTMQVRGQPVDLAIKVGELAITKRMIWLGADVQIHAPALAAPPPAASPVPAAASPTATPRP
jgi:hypothetical protein